MVGRVQKGKRIAIGGSIKIDNEFRCEIVVYDFFLINKPEN